MDLAITTLAARPDLEPLLDEFPSGWPTFMQQDATGSLYYAATTQHYAEHVLMAYDADHPERLVAKAYTVPFHWDGDLPAGGWDAVITRSAVDRLIGRDPDHVSALEILVQTDLRGTGLSAVMLGAMRANARRLGFTELVAPVRPNHKHKHPHAPIDEYAHRVRDDGLPKDPWLRVHVRAGGRIDSVAPYSMTISAPLASWREWTGLPFDTDGEVLVPEALTPVRVDPRDGTATYIEPNVWVRHDC
ncbi:N-acetyltransferase [Actinokineospora bangkokensis]|uniref:N-acetyltransferase n=1 Tax=Actinokineospora bangkokensis TaxID=1193682 RepID=A0A1Q9LFD3_9PSEU|nr:N-acetyltransferase [Actinokineospora bangkokensis]OLR90715.1 N-acetyltransferase [Actinokineospora bangkokensis]